MQRNKMAALILFLFVLSGCGVSQDKEAKNVKVEDTETEDTETEDTETEDTDAEDTDAKENGSEELLDAFLASEIPAIYEDRDDMVVVYDQLPHDENDWECYTVGERIDLDNDGEVEQIVDGPYGGIYLDARDGKVYVLAQGEGTAGVLSYADYDGAMWIVHSDTWHAGRQMYWLSKYDGKGKIVDEFELGAQYWDSPDDRYDENSDFSCRGEKISMREYEDLRREIVGW